MCNGFTERNPPSEPESQVVGEVRLGSAARVCGGCVAHGAVPARASLRGHGLPRQRQHEVHSSELVRPAIVAIDEETEP